MKMWEKGNPHNPTYVIELSFIFCDSKERRKEILS